MSRRRWTGCEAEIVTLLREVLGSAPSGADSTRRGVPGRSRTVENFVPTIFGRRHDAFLWFDETSALEPLHGIQAAGGEEETWPSGV